MKDQDSFLRELPRTISTIFEQVQKDSAPYTRHCATLFKLHVRCVSSDIPLHEIGSNIAKSSKATRNKSKVDFSCTEFRFNGAFFDMIYHALLAKPASAATRAQDTCRKSVKNTANFIGSYLKYLNAKEQCTFQHIPVPPGLFKRFFEVLVGHLAPSLYASDHIIRERVLGLFSAIFDSINEHNVVGICDNLRETVLERCCDKRATIRSMAISCLVKLSAISSADHGINKLKVLMATDPDPTVRRSALELAIALPNPKFKYILHRTRDVDPSVRKLAFSGFHAFPESPLFFLNLEHLQRMEVLQAILDEPDADVLPLAINVLSVVFNKLKKLGVTTDTFSVLCDFTNLFGPISPHERTMTTTAIDVLFSRNADLLRDFLFPGSPAGQSLDHDDRSASLQFWTTMDICEAMLSFVFVSQCTQEDKYISYLESAGFPSLIDFSTYLQHCYDTMILSVLPPLATQASLIIESGSIELQEIRLFYLVSIATRLDFGDELGRRRIFSICSEMLSHPSLPSSLLEPCLDLLCIVMSNEKDFIRVVVEVTIDMREVLDDIGRGISIARGSQSSDASRSTQRGDRSFKHMKELKDMTPEEKAEAEKKDVRSLEITVGMLSRIKGAMNDNSTLDGLLADLIIPCVKRNDNLELRETGLHALALMCLSSLDLSKNAIPLFLNQFHASDASNMVRVTCVQGILDIALLFWHEDEFDEQKSVVKNLLVVATGEGYANEGARKTAIEGCCKLLVWYGEREIGFLEKMMEIMLCEKQSEIRKCLEGFMTTYFLVSSGRADDVQKLLVPVVCQAMKKEGFTERHLCKLLNIVVGGLKDERTVKIQVSLDVLNALNDPETSRHFKLRGIFCIHVLDKMDLTEVTSAEKERLDYALEKCAADKHLSKFKKKVATCSILP